MLPTAALEFTDDTLLFAAIGVMTLAAALLPRLLGKLPISIPMVFLRVVNCQVGHLPSTRNSAPRMNAASSPARNSTIAAMSAGVPKRPSRVAARSRPRVSGGIGMPLMVIVPGMDGVDAPCPECVTVTMT